MPIYEYECKACNHRFEAIQKFSDSPLIDCPACSAAELRKLVSAPAFRLKGAGWYETDFKSGGKRNLAEGGGDAGGSSADSSSGESTSGGSSESAAKPAASGSSGGSTSSSPPASSE